MPVISANGIQQYYEIAGDGPPLVLVAGMGGTANYWQDTAAFFAEHYTVLTYDQRGTGRSEILPVTGIEQLRDDLLALLDALGLDRVDFLGHSTGGNIAQIFAIENAGRLAKLVIYASTTHGDHYRTKVWRVRRAILEKLGPELYGDMSSIMLYPPRWIVENAEKLESQQAGQMSMLAPSEVMTSRIEAVQAFDRRGQLDRITTPTLVICAQDDNQTPAYFSEYLAANIPSAELILMDYGAHACSRTAPDEFNQHVLGFLQKK
jgi:aminoacrylate hydrolase